jgi:hypothetical protein
VKFSIFGIQVVIGGVDPAIDLMQAHDTTTNPTEQQRIQEAMWREGYVYDKRAGVWRSNGWNDANLAFVEE